jgi:flagellar basal body-associated protein FliL
VEHQETLKTSTVVSEFSDSVQAKINNFLTNGVVSSGEVVSSIFFTGDKLFGVE